MSSAGWPCRPLRTQSDPWRHDRGRIVSGAETAATRTRDGRSSFRRLAAVGQGVNRSMLRLLQNQAVRLDTTVTARGTTLRRKPICGRLPEPAPGPHPLVHQLRDARPRRPADHEPHASRTRKHPVDASDRGFPPLADPMTGARKEPIMFVELDTRQDAGYTISLERGRDEDVRIVVELRRRSSGVDGQTVTGSASCRWSGFVGAVRMA